MSLDVLAPDLPTAWLVSNGDNDASEFEFCKQASLRGWKVSHSGARESDYAGGVRFDTRVQERIFQESLP